jgi:hypothetical protein
VMNGVVEQIGGLRCGGIVEFDDKHLVTGDLGKISQCGGSALKVPDVHHQTGCGVISGGDEFRANVVPRAELALSAALMATLLSVLTSISSVRVGPMKSPSLIRPDILERSRGRHRAPEPATGQPPLEVKHETAAAAA